MREFSRETDESLGRLLVVDDDLVQRTVVGKIGAKTGYDCLVVPSLELSESALSKEAFDVMAVDLSLGERDGIELLRFVAERDLRDMSIVVISGCDGRVLKSTRRVAESLGLSVIGVLSKPLNLDELKDLLQLPRRKRASADLRSATVDVSPERIAAGIRQGEFLVEFQPKVELESGRVVGAEALARWRTSEFGIISPVTFIPIAEQCGLMPELTDTLLTSAMSQGRKLINRYPDFTIAVNVSGSLLSDLTLPERIEEVLRKEQVPPHCLIVEITETTAMADVDRATDVLVRLRLKNIGTAIDDFGTGYSSLAALAKLPFSELKIDGSFINGCEADEDMAKIVEASVGLGRAFNMKVVAEGVETPETLARIRRAGCDIGQGYFFSPSLRLARAESWVSQRNEFVSQRINWLNHRSQVAPDGDAAATRIA
ncbi:EAL domain-containing response regulator [Bradyrhizobium betae]|uniref:EAL domain-containing response regulator n=1 Tax=Bradyrhizobium betae TaxID=244734 RepID=A0A5P6PA98_9BRAD|nr:EAL domain-containing response regulator [Bradyrhizobium betae]MCS3729050.1 EAL domain-containing protein (putative c-di-GMP-specific phosphodiesterase class I) [Bradyrhizobium betae]QFI74403.1 EAL domain-containing response regulator [Bradyrhizobium betae]